MISQITLAAALLATSTLAQSLPVPEGCDMQEHEDYYHHLRQQCHNAPLWSPPKKCKTKNAYCRMQANPAYPTTALLSGSFRLAQFNIYDNNAVLESDGLFIRGRMGGLPQPNPSEHMLSINENSWDNLDCGSAGDIYQHPGQEFGPMNRSMPETFTGKLCPVQSNNVFGYAHYPQVMADKPDLLGVNDIVGRTMVVYEKGDDFYGDPTNKPIACCEVRAFGVFRRNLEEGAVETNLGRSLEAVDPNFDLFSVDEFRELFGEEPEEHDFINN